MSNAWSGSGFKVSFNETHELGEQAAEGPVFKSKKAKEKLCVWQMPERAWLQLKSKGLPSLAVNVAMSHPNLENGPIC